MTGARTLHASHIAAELDRRFTGLIDLSDIAGATEKVQRDHFLTRAQAAFALVIKAGISDKVAADAVTDGSQDNGIDAVYADTSANVVWLVQSKWHTNGTKSLGKGDALAFIQGLKALSDFDAQQFNDKVKSKLADVETVLSDPDFTIRMLVVVTGGHHLAQEVRQPFDDLLEDWNYADTSLSVDVLGLAQLHDYVKKGVIAAIDLDVTLENWGVVTEPYVAYYGVVSASDVADWFRTWGDTLFDKNLRSALGSTPVNAALAQTLSAEPEKFWYFNNGVTILANEVGKTGAGGQSRAAGVFKLRGASVVNGAQTVSSIASVVASVPTGEFEPKVWLRVISLAGAPDDFANRVTRATNTQNSVENRDFMALDANQERIRSELWLSHKVSYVYKRGDSLPANGEGCTGQEALVALACLHPDSTFAVLAKSNLGRLEDTGGKYYQTLFNSSTPGNRVWLAVRVLRAVEEELRSRRSAVFGKDRSIAIQGNRIIVHLVFKRLGGTKALDLQDPANIEPLLENARAEARNAHALVVSLVERHFSSNYVTSLFKNSERCGQIVAYSEETWAHPA